MIRKRTALLLTLFSLFITCDSKPDLDKQLSIIVTPPSNFNPKDTIHIFGNFNNWMINGDDAYRLTYDNGKLRGEIPVNRDNLFFSFAKNNSYGAAPASLKGKRKPDYIFKGDSQKKEIEVTIPLWIDDTPLEEVTHTVKGNVEILANFNMPQLNRTGDISVYLPPSYATETSKSYPVLYMLDGQNVFDEYTAFSGEWQVDEIMEQLISENKIKEIIVVAVPNGDRRWNEYVPWDYINKFLGDTKTITKGEGEQTMQFITQTLKPQIDEKFRTKTDVKHTGFTGSSLGGLMALYAGTNYHNTFGFIGAFSPSLAIRNSTAEDVLTESIKNVDAIGNSRFYIDMGKVEYNSGYKKVEALEQVLLDNGVNQSRLKLVKDDLGRHCEEDWSKRFPEAIQWLLQGLE